MSRAPSTLMTNFSDGNIIDFIDSRNVEIRNDIDYRLQMHSSLVRRLSFERELEGHQGCVNSVAWNSSGSLLVSGSDDALINIWSYSSRKLLHSIESGHSANIFCAKFVPETCDELVVSGAGDAEVRQFNLSLLTTGKPGESAIEPSALFQCHSRRVKKLAVEVGNPNVVWSASEDGTLRQHDFREGTSCPPNGSSHQECRSVLLDMRCGAKKSLADPPKQCLSLKSCDISTTRPHLLLVGGSDAFARLYDRRMLPPLSSCQTMTKPPPCIDYFCPMHLSDRRTPSLHLTHVTFSPTGEEVLLSYSGEHVYLMDVNTGGEIVTKYSVDDVSEQYKLVPTTSRTTTEVPAPRVFGKDIRRRRRNSSDMLSKCKELVEIAEASLRESKNYYGIEACNEVLDGNASVVGPKLRHECLCTRAALLLKRKWKNDIHMAVRDCNKARSIDPLSFKAHFYMSEALLQLGKHKEALEYAIAAQLLAPSNTEVAERVISIKEHLAAAEAEKSNTNDGQSQSEARPGRMRTAIDVLNSDAPVDDVRSREDSDYEAEVELDFETSVSGDEANAAHSGPHINFRFRRRSDSARESSCTNGSCGSTSSSSSQNDNTSYQPETVVDMKQRYVGHCNVGTDIKQASFLGQRGEYVASGSDDGRWFIWEKRTGRLVKMLSGDEAVVNCVQCHPFDCTIATSGIDNTIKIWTPEAPVPSIVAGVSVGPEMGDVLSAMETNQNKLSRNRNVLPFELLERFRMHEFAEGTLHPFECAQT
ncbi:WD and tetratricopeptide repeats protein 1-like [Papaver somniferum]|uniref:WD and tetratricopeptide repeats protein 1-like n=1 Tax=Papaver somniferum TaxID=3469 RepID=UPI000E6F637B|nr:WD and tetratricopeptide repeats protein 1-like [Papaver somniferum]